MLVISEANARGLCTTALEQLGLRREDAAICADNLVFASLRGIDTHGICGPFLGYLAALRQGRIRPDAEIRVVRETETMATVDGGGALGAVIGVRCMDLAIAKAQRYGMGAVAAYNANHYGAASYYPMRALKYNMIGFTCCNGTPRVVPFGGREGLHGANPISFAVPSKTIPIVGDLSTSVVAVNQLNKAKRLGRSMPIGWALDPEGNPTTDPDAGRAGYLLPMAAHKGYALSLLVDVLAGAITGSLVGREIPRDVRPDTPNFVSHFFMALRASDFASVETLTSTVSKLVDDAHAIPPAEGFSEVLVPGEPELRTERERKAHGIPLTENEWKLMREAFTRNELDADDLERRFGPTSVG